MNILFVDDLVQRISQYYPTVYCLLRLVNHEVKQKVDEVLPRCIPAAADDDYRDELFPSDEDLLSDVNPDSGSNWTKFLNKSIAWCGFKLLDCRCFDLWIDAMMKSFQKDNERHGEIVEKFCRDYHPKKQRVGRIALHMLCEMNRRSFVWELWKEDRLYADCIREIAMMDDVDLFVMAHARIKDGISMNLVKDCVQNAYQYQRWETTKYLWNQYSTDDDIKQFFITIHQMALSGMIVEYMDPFLIKNKEVMLATAEENEESVKFADESLRKDKEFVLDAVKRNVYSLQYAHETLRKDKETILQAVKHDMRSLKYADESLQKDKDVILEAIKDHVDALKYADQSLRKDKSFIRIAMKIDEDAINFADRSLLKEKTFILELVKQYGEHVVFYADKSLQKDKEIVLEAVKKRGEALMEADLSLRKDKAFVLEVIKIDPLGLRYAHKSLRKDRIFVLEAVKICGLVLESAGDFKKDEEIVLAAVKQNEDAWKFADQSLKEKHH